MIADTSFLIDMMMNEPKAVSKAKEIEHKGSTIGMFAFGLRAVHRSGLEPKA